MWGGGNYELINFKHDESSSSYQITFNFKPLQRPISEITFEFSHSGGAPERNCVANLTVPEARRAAPAEWAQLLNDKMVFDGDRIKLYFAEGKYKPSKTAKLQVTLQGAQPLSLEFGIGKMGFACAPAEETGGTTIGDDELTGGVVRRVVRNLRRPFITIVTLDKNWRNGTLGITEDKYQNFWNRVLATAYATAAGESWELAVLKRVQNGDMDAGELKKLVVREGRPSYFTDIELSAYAESLVSAFKAKAPAAPLVAINPSDIDRALDRIFDQVTEEFGPNGPDKTPAGVLVAGAVTPDGPSGFCQAQNRLSSLNPKWYGRHSKVLAVELWGKEAVKSMLANNMISQVEEAHYLFRCELSAGAEQLRVYGLEAPYALQEASSELTFKWLTPEIIRFLKN